MSDNDAVEVNKITPDVTSSSSAEHFANEALLQPHEAFGKFATTLIPTEATSPERIAVIQEASKRFNEVAPEARKIQLLYHFTDSEGAKGISEQGLVGKATDTRVYLTALTPEIAQPLASAEDARGFETYFKERKTPQTLREHMERFVLGMKFKWRHDVQKRLLHKPIVPIGANKLESVVMLAVGKGSEVIKRDEQGEVYIERPIRVNSDPDFQVFGPFPTPEKEINKAK